MSDVVIRAVDLGKTYRIGVAEKYRTLRESLTYAVTSPFTRSARRQARSDEIVHALRDLSFEVCRGDVVGIIGRNGAGKSTLLKVLSRITSPSSGFVEVLGTVGSLLEVGTGFHPELTGRENIYLNGAILGMTRREITGKFDEIVAFSEIEKFLDTPVKRYSSGMYMRLAFAVAAHLEPEILVVDEVLAVGDAAFQKKCLGKLSEVSGHGRTVLFVSHNIGAITSLCKRAILLAGGRIEREGPATEVAAAYQRNYLALPSNESDLSRAARRGTGAARFTAVRVQALDLEGRPLQYATEGSDLEVEVHLASEQGMPPANVAVVISDINGYRLVDINTALAGQYVELPPGGSTRVRFVARDLRLRAGTYIIGLWVGRHSIEDIDYIEHASGLSIAEPSDALTGLVFPGPYACRFDVVVGEATPELQPAALG